MVGVVGTATVVAAVQQPQAAMPVVVQATGVSPPATMTVSAVVAGGQTQTVNTPSGMMEITVPLGVQPGQEFQFQMPSTSQSAQPSVIIGVPM